MACKLGIVGFNGRSKRIGWNDAGIHAESYRDYCWTAGKTDLETPSTTEIITEKDIKEKGYTSVFDALEHTVGITAFLMALAGRMAVGM